MKPAEICELHQIEVKTLNNWLRQRRAGGSFSPIVTKRREGRGITRCKVAAVRRVIGMLDQGVSVSYAAREMKLPRTTIRRWRDNPDYREATFEYNPDFSYDPDDLTDRSVVAHALCAVEPNPDERLDMMLAIVGLSREDAPKGQRVRGKRNRKGAQ